MIFRCGFRAVVIYFFGVYFCDFDHLVIKFVRVENARDNKTFVYRALNLFKCLFPLLDLIFPIESKVQSALSDKNCSRDSQPTTWNLFLTMMRLVNYSIHSISTKLFLVTMTIILCWLTVVTDWQNDSKVMRFHFVGQSHISLCHRAMNALSLSILMIQIESHVKKIWIEFENMEWLIADRFNIRHIIKQPSMSFTLTNHIFSCEFSYDQLTTMPIWNRNKIHY